MPRLIIHPGSPKTGTSTLQRFLHTHREILREQGIHVYSPANFRKDKFMQACRRGTRGGDWPTKAQFEAFAAETRDAETVLISEEGFCSSFLLGLTEESSGLERADLSAKLISEMPFEDIRAVLTIRQQRGFVVSNYVHSVKLHREKRSFRRWINEMVDADRLSWQRVADEFETALGKGKVSLLPFEIVKAHGAEAYIRAFFEKAGLPFVGMNFDDVKAANLSASHAAVTASRIFNGFRRDEKQRHPFNAWMTRTFPATKYGSFRPRIRKLDEIEAAYEAENAAIAARWFPEYAACYCK